MNRIIAIILGLALMTQCIVQLGAILQYRINKEYIAKNLCENKDKPELNCCGKCQLRKEVRKSTEGSSTEKNGIAKIDKTEMAAFILPLSPHRLPVFADVAATPQHPGRQHLHGHLATAAIFHPPAFCC